MTEVLSPMAGKRHIVHIPGISIPGVMRKRMLPFDHVLLRVLQSATFVSPTMTPTYILNTLIVEEMDIDKLAFVEVSAATFSDILDTQEGDLLTSVDDCSRFLFSLSLAA